MGGYHQGLGKAKMENGGLVVASSQFQQPKKHMLTLKVVESESKIIISLLSLWFSPQFRKLFSFGITIDSARIDK